MVKVKIKLPTTVEGDQRAPFSIATTPRCRGGRYSIPRIAPLYPWYVPYIAEFKQGGIKYYFKVFGMTRRGIEPRSSSPLANSLPTKPMSRYMYGKV